MQEDFSEAWERLMKKQKEFMIAAKDYRESSTLRDQKRDIMISLDDSLGAMSTIRLIKDGYISIDEQPSVWYRLIALVFETDPSIASWIVEVLSALPEGQKAELRQDAFRLVSYYSDSTQNELGMLISLKLLISIGCEEEEINEYLAKYAALLNL
ncbi:MAG: hypothetical protein FWG30_05705 [Eubacteriaceae bacterium]|nr:hypothetical protein [Eubacteriaceae bacterium]